MLDLAIRAWPILVGGAAAAAWLLGLAYRIAATVTRIEGDLRHVVERADDHETRLRTVEASSARHSGAIDAL